MKTPFFQRSKIIFQSRTGSLKNRFQYLGFMDAKNELTCDPGELNMHEGMKFHGKIVNDFFEEGELIHIDGIKMSGYWYKNRLTRGQITFSSFNEIACIQINERENQYSYMTKNNKVFAIKDESTFEFEENQNSYKFKFNFIGKILSISMNVLPIEQFKKNSSVEVNYNFRPSLYLTKTIKIDNLLICFEFFANFKISYSIENKVLKTQNTSKTRIVLYSNGRLFYSQSSFPSNIKESNSMNGILIDLDEYLGDKKGTKTFPQYEHFMFTNGKFVDEPIYQHKKSVLAHELVGGVLENLFYRKSVLNFLVNRMTKLVSKNFDWKNWTKAYWKELIDQKEHFSYKSRLSKAISTYRNEKDNVKNFDWNDRKNLFF